jgi:hypothetical protein
MHDHIAGTDFLSDFHKVFPVSAGRRLAMRRTTWRVARFATDDCGPAPMACKVPQSLGF